MDYAKLANLLDVIHKAAAAGPAYQWIVDAANKDVSAMKPADPVPEPAPGAASEPDAEEESNENE